MNDNIFFRTREILGKKEIFDVVRQKYVALTPEETVRQSIIKHLYSEKNYPLPMFAIEKEIKINTLSKRFDIAVFNNRAIPIMIIECKAPMVNITQDTFDQIARYNMNFKVKFLVVTNGINTYCCMIDYLKNNYHFIKEIPDYNLL